MSSRHPTAAQSEARRAQLDRLIAQRRAARELGRRTYPRRVPSEHALAVFPITYRQFMTELQRQAMGGRMPSMRVFDYAKPTTWPTAEECCAHFALSWEELAEEAGLERPRYTSQPGGASCGQF